VKPELCREVSIILMKVLAWGGASLVKSLRPSARIPNNNYRLTLIDLKNVGHQDDPCVLADRVTLVFYVLSIETGKHVVVS
jgi:hypothetical protein